MATGAALLILAAIAVSVLGVGAAAQPQGGRSASAPQLASVTVDYPLDGSIFPPEITPPTFIWRDAAANASRWRIDIAFADGSAEMHAESAGAQLAIGAVDPLCISSTNKLPTLTPEQAAAHTWIPDAAAWEAIKRHSIAGAAVVTISGFSPQDAEHAVSSGRVKMLTSKDPAGAPIFYRDVPLMPSETEKGVIKPLAPGAVTLIQWRLRDIAKPESRVVMKGLHVCANCHSFARDGKTMGMDMDGPSNDKGLYALVPVQPQMTIKTTDMVTWNPSHDPRVSLNRVGFMSQVSPDGKYVVTMVNTADQAAQINYYTANFKDYRFLQVFYPTRGILAWYSRATGRRQPLPGADDPRYVQANAVWSPDGSYLVFARAAAKEPYPRDGKMAMYATDPHEVQMQYDLYRIPFNGGKGGEPQALAGASHNGMSNTFPKVSPDGRWIVFVRCHNGLLMRPDSQLYIVPAQGGQARRMRCNTSLMNSWHSFSPNGRWLVFSSKARSPYTQMYLTHIDEQGNDSPAILIDNSTAANRAVNIPEFVNIPPDGMVAISTPAVEIYKKYDHAAELQEVGKNEAAIAVYREIVTTLPDDSRVHYNLGTALTQTGRYAEAISEFEETLKLEPLFSGAYKNLGGALLAAGRPDEAIVTLKKGLGYYPDSADFHNDLGSALARQNHFDAAKAEFDKALEIDPNLADAHHNLGRVLAAAGQLDEAVPHFEKAIAINPSFDEAHSALGCVLVEEGQSFDQAIAHLQKALELKPGLVEAHNCLGAALYISQARTQEALAQWREALRLDPNFAPAMNEAAHALAASPEASDRNGAEAVKLAERAVQLTGGQDPDYLDTLGSAYAEAGRFTEAIAAARKALDLATRQHLGQFVEALNARIKMYEAHQPFRDAKSGR